MDEVTNQADCHGCELMSKGVSIEEFRTQVTSAARAPLLARITELEARLAAVQQGVQPSRVADSIAPTFMTNEQAIAWAWADVRKDVGTENWTTGDSCNFYGFFLHGWHYRGQYEVQRNATKAAVTRELATHPTQQGQQITLNGWQLLHALRLASPKLQFNEDEMQQEIVVSDAALIDPVNNGKLADGPIAWVDGVDESAIALADERDCPALGALPTQQGLDAIKDPHEMARWLLARRSHLGPNRQGAAGWDEAWGAKSWDNYTALADALAAQAKQVGVA